MKDRISTSSAMSSESLAQDRGAALAMTSDRVGAVAREWLRETMAGLVAAVVLIANIVSFGALMFPGDLRAGMPMAIWAMLIGSSISGVWIALKTSLPPIATGIDSPTGAVLVLLSASAGPALLAAGAGPAAAAQSVMLIFTAATLLSGAMLCALGAVRWGSYFRFVPYSVISGFLAATGWFLIAGGLRMATGRALSFGSLVSPWTAAEAAKLGAALGVLFLLSHLRRWFKSAFAMPVALLVMWLVGSLLLRLLGLAAPEHGWHFNSMGQLARWAPLEAFISASLPWSMLAGSFPKCSRCRLWRSCRWSPRCRASRWCGAFPAISTVSFAPMASPASLRRLSAAS